MLLTVFGILSGNGNKRQKHNNAQAAKKGHWRLSFFFDYCFKTRKHCLLYNKASILACNIVAVLLIPFGWNNGPYRQQLVVLLTVARQPAIYTRFLFNPCPPQAGNHIAEKK